MRNCRGVGFYALDRFEAVLAEAVQRHGAPGLGLPVVRLVTVRPRRRSQERAEEESSPHAWGAASACALATEFERGREFRFATWTDESLRLPASWDGLPWAWSAAWLARVCFTCQSRQHAGELPSANPALVC